MVARREHESSFHVVVASTCCEECSNGAALSLDEVLECDTCGAEGASDASEVAHAACNSGVGGGDRVAECRLCVFVALGLEPFDFAFLTSIGRFHKAEGLVWFRAVLLFDGRWCFVVALCDH